MRDGYSVAICDFELLTSTKVNYEYRSLPESRRCDPRMPTARCRSRANSLRVTSRSAFI